MQIQQVVEGHCRSENGKHYHEPQLEVRLNVAEADALFVALAGYDEFIGDKLEYAADYPDEYEPSDVQHMVDERDQVSALFEAFAPAYSQLTRRVADLQYQGGER